MTALKTSALAAILSLSCFAGFAAADVSTLPERDAEGRLVRETKMIDGKVHSVKQYKYNAAGELTNTTDTFADGQVFGENFYAKGKLSLQMSYRSDCGVGQAQWTPDSVSVTTYAADGKTRVLRQDWSLDKQRQPGTLMHVSEFDANGKPSREWHYGAFMDPNDDQSKTGKLPSQVTLWSKGKMVVEELRTDGSVRQRTTYGTGQAQPAKETFSGKEGGERTIDPTLTKFPTDRVKR